MKRILFFLSFLLLVNFGINAQDSTRTGLLYGYNNAYYLTAPIGWVMDNENGKEEGLTAVFYPKGSTWAEGETVMYTTFTNYDTTKKETVMDVIKGDSIDYKLHSPQLQVRKQKDIMVGKKKKAIVISYSATDIFEEVAYIAEKKGVVMIIMSSRNKNGCINNHKNFEALVRSYKFLTDQVNIKVSE
ncbi:MAG: hypothetical protein JWO44_2004 [Bacteroidetes bacterium]|nr:hypothetical protein [Bacteroidota bacterium]